MNKTIKFETIENPANNLESVFKGIEVEVRNSDKDCWRGVFLRDTKRYIVFEVESFEGKKAKKSIPHSKITEVEEYVKRSPFQF